MTEDERTYREKLGQRISLARGDRSQISFAEDLGVNKNTLLGYEKGRVVPDILTVRKICTLSGVNWDWLASGEGRMRPEEQGVIEERSLSTREIKEMPQPQTCMVDANGNIVIPRWQNPDSEMFDYIPMAEAQLSAGGGCFVLSEDIEGYYAFRKTWLSRVASSAKNLVLMRVQGDSMSPTIQDGDTVMIDTGRLSIKEGMLYALRVNSTIMIKRLSLRLDGKVLIISDNRNEYDPFEAETKNLHIIGQVIFFSRTFVSD